MQTKYFSFDTEGKRIYIEKMEEFLERLKIFTFRCERRQASGQVVGVGQHTRLLVRVASSGLQMAQATAKGTIALRLRCC
jgi:hypothetical protein